MSRVGNRIVEDSETEREYNTFLFTEFVGFQDARICKRKQEMEWEVNGP